MLGKCVKSCLFKGRVSKPLPQLLKSSILGKERVIMKRMLSKPGPVPLPPRGGRCKLLVVAVGVPDANRDSKTKRRL